MGNTETLMLQRKRWLNPVDLEAEFGILKSTQAKLRSQGNIPYSKRGKYIFYDRKKIDAWLEDAEMV